MQALTPQDLLELLNSKDHAGVIDRKDEPVLTEKELDVLLDRSDLTWQKIGEDQNLKHDAKKKPAEDFGYLFKDV